MLLSPYATRDQLDRYSAALDIPTRGGGPPKDLETLGLAWMPTIS